MEKYLISGIKGGLGKYLYDNLPNSIGFGRDEFNLIKNKDFDTIIHCAFNKEQHEIKDYYGYLEDNIFLTQNLLKLPYKKFIFLGNNLFLTSLLYFFTTFSITVFTFEKSISKFSMLFFLQIIPLVEF